MRGPFANGLPPCLDGVGGQIRATIPFDEVSAVDNSLELVWIVKAFERLISQVRTHIEDANTTVVRDDGERPIGLRANFLDSH